MAGNQGLGDVGKTGPWCFLHGTDTLGNSNFHRLERALPKYDESE